MDSARRSALAGGSGIRGGAHTAVIAKPASRSTHVLTLLPLAALPVPAGHVMATALAENVPVDAVYGSCGCRTESALVSVRAQPT